VTHFILNCTRSEIDERIGELRERMYEARRASPAKALQLTNHLLLVEKQRAAINHEVNRKLYRTIRSVEQQKRAEWEQAQLGVDTVFTELVASNPLLTGNSPNDDNLLVEHYVLLGYRAEDVQRLLDIDRVIRDVFHAVIGPARGREYTDETGTEAWQSDLGDVQLQLGWFVDPKLGLLAPHEASGSGWSWLDAPDNVDILLNTYKYEGESSAQGFARQSTRAARLGRHLRFQRGRLVALDYLLQDQGHLSSIIAAYETVPIWRESGGQINPHLIHQYLSGDLPWKKAWPKLQMAERISGQGLSQDPLKKARDEVVRCPRSKRHAYVRRFLRDILGYRNDLLMYLFVHGLLEQIRVLENPDEIRLSRANQRLYAYTESEKGEEAAAISSHVVIKADIRGSSELTTEMMRHDLNPATHFDQYFFGPINNLYRKFGAEKVFMEGDAIILTLLEYQESGEAPLTVANACSLAQGILDIVTARNELLHKEGLPLIEIGIGIVYHDAPPTYLYDESRPVMISPAINQADRLSSCARFLHRQGAEHPMQRVAVYELVAEDRYYGEKGQTDAQYNVNGIRLGDAAFEKLRRETSLEKLESEDPQLAGLGVFYHGRYPDRGGEMRELLVRQGNVKRLDRGNGKAGPTDRRYLEVVVERELKQRVAASGAGPDGGAS
jgi:hypothetical protein